MDQRRSGTDLTGALLVAVGAMGALAWMWALVRSQYAGDPPDGLAERIDLLVDETPLLLLSVIVGGVGAGLRSLAASATDVGGQRVVGRPVGWMLLAFTAALVVIVGATWFLSSGDDDPADGLTPDVSWDDIVELQDRADMSVTREAPTSATLEVHDDGCGLIRSGEIGDDVTWVISDLDGFEVLSRNAAGETRYRYFQPGTYQAVLEAWTGTYSGPVSNQVTITC